MPHVGSSDPPAAFTERLVVLAFALGLSALARPAHSARAPDIVKRSFVFHGQAAETLARLLQLPPDRPANVRYELSQAAEHRALPESDAALRDPRGTLRTDITLRASDRIDVTATWDPRARRLRLDGWVADLSTGFPRAEGPACAFGSPYFFEKDIDRFPGWKALFLALRALEAQPGQGLVAEQRTREEALDAERRAVVSLVRMNLWDDDSRPVQRSAVSVAFGPPVAKGCR
jgi:hypothetical protein